MVGQDELTILHFNDVYHLSDASLIARFASILADPGLIAPGASSVGSQQLRLFSGDVFSPSLEASVLRGEHMTELLNEMGIDVACYGNHDFDFGEARLSELSRQTKFPWTLANAVRRQSGAHDRLLAEACEHIVREFGGYRIGFFGLAGTDWPSNCQHLPDCEILCPSTVALKVAAHLRRVEKCDFVIALTHMRLAEDLVVSSDTASGDGRVDLLLGGHDHHVVCHPSTEKPGNPGMDARETPDVCAIHEGDVRIVKSGTDWRGLSVIQLKMSRKPDHRAFLASIKLKQIANIKALPNYDKIPPCPRVLDILSKVQSRVSTIVQQPLLYTDVPLYGRSHAVRSQETNLGNMLADAVRAFYDADIALVNSGGIRCDRVIQPSDDGAPLCIRDVVDTNPFDNAFVVKRVPGSALGVALENSVSDSHTDGRFLQLAGLRIRVDWRHPEGRRILGVEFVPRSSGVGEDTTEALDPERLYTVAMVEFIASGFDGYACFKDLETVVDAEGAMTDTKLLMEIFGGNALAREDSDGSVRAVVDATNSGIERARRAVICRRHSADDLPVVSPVIDGRIQVVRTETLN